MLSCGLYKDLTFCMLPPATQIPWLETSNQTRAPVGWRMIINTLTHSTYLSCGLVTSVNVHRATQSVVVSWSRQIFTVVTTNCNDCIDNLADLSKHRNFSGVHILRTKRRNLILPVLSKVASRSYRNISSGRGPEKTVK